jgi:hypothetical protein
MEFFRLPRLLVKKLYKSNRIGSKITQNCSELLLYIIHFTDNENTDQTVYSNLHPNKQPEGELSLFVYPLTEHLYWQTWCHLAENC